jgi:3-deoxy-D-manno-octulosonic-acid transferase
MYFLYSLGLSLLFLALLPYFIYQAARHGKYIGSFRERLGSLPTIARSDGRKTIWVHAVSVGEFLAARSLITRIAEEWPGHRLVVSTTTATGQGLARSQTEAIDATFYFPFDWRFSVRRALACVKPSVAIILETELWPNFLRECRQRGVTTILVNGRISARSYTRYRHAHSLMKRTLEDVSRLIMQSQADADRALQLGAPADRIRVCGNLKYDQSALADSEAGHDVQLEVDRLFELSRSPHLIVAGSTTAGEEAILLDSFLELRSQKGLEDARLLIAPRHPERFDEVSRLLSRSDFSFTRRSDFRLFEGKFKNSGLSVEKMHDVILLDTIGELASVYRFAAVVFVGGSLVPGGGHNILEPAAFAKPIMVGPHTENFRQIISDFVQDDAVVQTDSHALTGELARLLLNKEEACAIGKRARSILLRNKGATECTIGAIADLID